MSRHQQCSVLALALLASLAYAEVRLRSVQRSCSEDSCPSYDATILFDCDQAHILSKSSLFHIEMAAPYASPVFQVTVDGPADTRLWQLRTISVFDQPSQKVTHVLVPFLLSPGDPFVLLSKSTLATLNKYGLQESESALCYCSVGMPLPLRNATCVRAFTPIKFPGFDDERKNVLGAADAAAVIAIDRMVRGSGISDDAIVSSFLAEACPEAQYVSANEQIQCRHSARVMLLREINLLRAAHRQLAAHPTTLSSFDAFAAWALQDASSFPRLRSGSTPVQDTSFFEAEGDDAPLNDRDEITPEEYASDNPFEDKSLDEF